MAHIRNPRGGNFIALGEDQVLAPLDRKLSIAISEDWCSREGAMRLAANIIKFWRDHPNGYRVSCSIISEKKGSAAIYYVRSNLINGLPPRA